MKIDRMIGILAILLQRDSVTAPELARRFEVSRRTILRDVDSLCRAGIPIAARQGTGGGFAIMEGYRVDRALLTGSEMQAILAGPDGEYRLDAVQQAEIDRIAREKFATREWNLGRSPLTTFRRSGRFACGTVEVRFTVTRGILTELQFGGDFLGDRPAEELSAALKGCAYEPEAVRRCLASLDVSRFFDGLSADGLTDLICQL